MIKIYFLDQTDTSSAYYRIYIVSNELIKQGLAYSTVTGAVANNLKFKTKEELQKYILTYMLASDVVIAQMPSKIEILPLLEFAKENGKKLIIETDDLVHKLHDGFSKDKIDEAIKLNDDRQKLWSLADGFICSVGALVKAYSEMFNKPAWVFKNYIDFNEPRWDVPKIENSKLIIGWMGGSSHSEDLKIIEPVMDEILDKYDVSFQFVTFCPDWLKKRLGKDVRFIPTDGSINNYTPMIAQFDIGIIPLIDNEFNKCKSDLKYLEYSRLKVPTIASNTGVYSDIVNNTNGLLVRNKTGDWVKAISKLIENAPLRKSLADNAYKQVKYSRDIKTNAYRYIEIVNQILKRGKH